MWKIKKELLNEMINSAKGTYPKEFLCFLGGDAKKEVITEFVFIPNESDNHSAMVYENTIPFDDTIIGTLHSHPNSTNTPSSADRKMFSKYKINLILGSPFLIENACVYNEKGERIIIELV